jgi:hypothetical protein
VAGSAVLLHDWARLPGRPGDKPDTVAPLLKAFPAECGLSGRFFQSPALAANKSAKMELNLKKTRA